MVLLSLLIVLLSKQASGQGAGLPTASTYVGRCMNSFCPTSWVSTTQIGDDYCDFYCMTPFCGYDSPDGTFENSDCYWSCADQGCDVSLLGNGSCESGTSYAACNNYNCGYDMGDCSYCADGCVKQMLHDGKQQTACDNSMCNFDGGDTGYCASKCSLAMLSNTACDSACLTAECNYDRPACVEVSPNTLCFQSMIGNGQCNQECNIAVASWDGGDCFCSPGCYDYMLGDGTCNNECATKECSYDEKDCVRTM